MVLVASITCERKNNNRLISKKGAGGIEVAMLLLALMMLMPGAEAYEDDEAYVVYTNGATSERNLPLCAGPREACNVIRQRFWLPQIVYRMCKCPDRTICPTEFTDLSDKRTIAFNVRAQLKFCSRVGELEHCGKNKIAADIGSNGTIHIHCYCNPQHFYKKLYKNSSGEYFKCVPYGSCWRGDLCGYITANSYETYHMCTCPARHICVLKDRMKVYADEFLYKGASYRGICIPRN